MPNIRERYAHQLTMMRDDLLHMGTLVEQALSKAITSLEKWDTVLAAQVVRDDAQIDARQHMVEETAIKLIALQQPVAHDLRLIGTVYAMAAELERIGDYARHIARRLQRLTARSLLVTPPHGIFEMAAIVQKMLRMSLDAFLRMDADTARALASYDNRIDELEALLRADLIAQARHNPDRIDAALDLLDVVHSLERTADRTTNIGERIIYMETSAYEDLN